MAVMASIGLSSRQLLPMGSSSSRNRVLRHSSTSLAGRKLTGFLLQEALAHCNRIKTFVMREALFTVSRTADGGLSATNNVLRLSIAAKSREELKQEARESLIRAIGPAHVGYRVRLQADLHRQSLSAGDVTGKATTRTLQA